MRLDKHGCRKKIITPDGSPWQTPQSNIDNVLVKAIARAHRIGRQGAVLAQRFVSRGRLEEGILELQERKRELAEAVLGEEATGFGKVDLDELRALI